MKTISCWLFSANSICAVNWKGFYETPRNFTASFLTWNFVAGFKQLIGEWNLEDLDLGFSYMWYAEKREIENGFLGEAF